MKISCFAVGSPSLCLALAVGRSAAAAAAAADAWGSSASLVGGRSHPQRVRGVQQSNRNHLGAAWARPPRELRPKMMKGKDCWEKKMMKRHKKGTTNDCSRITPAPTKKPRTAPTGQPSDTPSRTQKTTHRPIQMPSSQPSEQPTQMPTPSFCLQNTKLFDGPGGNGHRYYLSDFFASYYEVSVQWSNLPACCGGKVAHLATITSDSENTFIANNVSVYEDFLWIGLYDSDNDGTYQWVNDESVTYRSDVVSQYQSGACVQFFFGDWIPNSCDSSASGVFEWNCEDA